MKLKIPQKISTCIGVWKAQIKCLMLFKSDRWNGNKSFLIENDARRRFVKFDDFQTVL